MLRLRRRGEQLVHPDDRAHIDAIKTWLASVVCPMLPPEHRGEVMVIHKIVELLPGEPEHKFLVMIPAQYGGLLIGTRGKTAEAFRKILRTFARGRDWSADVDLRIVKKRAA